MQTIRRRLQNAVPAGSMLELCIVQGRVKALLRHEFFVGSLFYDIAVLHDQDQIRVPDRRKPVSDNETGSALHHVGHGILKHFFQAGVDR